MRAIGGDVVDVRDTQRQAVCGARQLPVVVQQPLQARLDLRYA